MAIAMCQTDLHVRFQLDYGPDQTEFTPRSKFNLKFVLVVTVVDGVSWTKSKLVSKYVGFFGLNRLVPACALQVAFTCDSPT